ncbi:MAG: hypothetical protein KDA37_14390 [Planctomycetales bacterium]|nr:hypothetical protein [Planctomycetales bacterium]MCA9646340.1 hypothetical protein [Myxococcales bacterium]
MLKSRLKIYNGPDEHLSTAAQPSVKVTLGEALPLLADAILSNRTWLADFEDDEITLSQDLYEVLLAYRFHSRPSA